MRPAEALGVFVLDSRASGQTAGNGNQRSNMKLIKLKISAGRFSRTSPRRTPGHRPLLALGAAACLILSPPNAWGAEPANDNELGKLKRLAITNYATLVSANYQDSLTATKNLKTAIESMLHKPSENSLQAAREAWLTARAPY